VAPTTRDMPRPNLGIRSIACKLHGHGIVCHRTAKSPEYGLARPLAANELPFAFWPAHVPQKLRHNLVVASPGFRGVVTPKIDVTPVQGDNGLTAGFVVLVGRGSGGSERTLYRPLIR